MSVAVSLFDDTRVPVRGSSAGCSSAMVRGPLGAPSSTTGVTGHPHSASASAAGSPMVAEQNTKVGRVPYCSHRRSSRRSTCARCVPNTPRNTCISSITTSRKRMRNGAQRAWLGSNPPWSISGLVNTTLAWVRA